MSRTIVLRNSDFFASGHFLLPGYRMVVVLYVQLVPRISNTFEILIHLEPLWSYLFNVDLSKIRIAKLIFTH